MGANKSKYDTDPMRPNVDKSSSSASDEQDAADDYAKIYGGSPTYNADPAADTKKTINGQDMWGTVGTDGTWVSNDGTVRVTKSGTIEHGYTDSDHVFHKSNSTTLGITTVPTLTMAYTSAPDFVPSSAAPSDDGPSGSVDAYLPYGVHFPDLRSAEQIYLNSTAAVQDGYEVLHAKITEAINNPGLFGQNTGTDHAYMGNAAGHDLGYTETWTPDETAEGGAQFAASINTRMVQAAQAVAGLIEGIGGYIALLNNAGQSYAATDAATGKVFTPPTVVEVSPNGNPVVRESPGGR